VKTPGGLDLDDLVQIGFEALWRAAQAFDETRGFRFTSYGGKAIVNAIVNAIRQRDVLDRSPLAILNDVPAAGENEAAADAHEVVHAGLARLPAERRELLCRRYGLNAQAPVTLREISAEEQVTLQAIALRERQAKKELKRVLTRMW
jgi:RNA polymerase sigma factor (sigma-70 family)